MAVLTLTLIVKSWDIRNMGILPRKQFQVANLIEQYYFLDQAFVANKVNNIRCALVHDLLSVSETSRPNSSCIKSSSEKVNCWLSTEFNTDTIHRIQSIRKIEIKENESFINQKESKIIK
jgi:hypothetical protein